MCESKSLNNLGVKRGRKFEIRIKSLVSAAIFPGAIALIDINT